MSSKPKKDDSVAVTHEMQRELTSKGVYRKITLLKTDGNGYRVKLYTVYSESAEIVESELALTDDTFRMLAGMCADFVLNEAHFISPLYAFSQIEAKRKKSKQGIG